MVAPGSHRLSAEVPSHNALHKVHYKNGRVFFSFQTSETVDLRLSKYFTETYCILLNMLRKLSQCFISVLFQCGKVFGCAINILTFFHVSCFKATYVLADTIMQNSRCKSQKKTFGLC